MSSEGASKGELQKVGREADMLRADLSEMSAVLKAGLLLFTALLVVQTSLDLPGIAC